MFARAGRDTKAWVPSGELDVSRRCDDLSDIGIKSL